MITLTDKLYESLLDDEEDLINDNSSLIENWAKILGLTKQNNKSNINSNVINNYYEEGGNIYTSTLNPNYILKSFQKDVSRNYELSIDDILPTYLNFKQIAGLTLGMNQVNYSCPDIMINKGLKKLSKYSIEKLTISYGNTKLNFLDFNLVGNPQMKTMHIQIPRLGDEYFVDIMYWPKFKLDTLWINSHMRPVILDNIKGLNCTNFIFEGARFSEDSLSKLTIDEPFKAVSTLDNTEKGIAILDRFFQNNKVDNLIYMRIFNMKTYRYRIDKKGRGKGYKLTRLK